MRKAVVKGAKVIKAPVQRFGDSSKAVRVLKPDIWMRLAPWQYPKVGRVVENMKQGEYTEVEINVVVKAVFITQADDDFDEVYNIFTAKLTGGEPLGAAELKNLLPHIGEKLSEDKIDQLLRDVDADGSGKIEQEELTTLLKACNPKDGSQGAFGVLKAMPLGLGDSLSTISVLDAQIQMRLNPMYIPKVGRIIKRMQGAGFDKKQINKVVKALFMSQSDNDFREAFTTLEKKFRRGQEADGEALDIDAFRQVLPLLGDDIDDEEFDQLFAEADADGSGTIDLHEFITLMKATNPKDAGEKISKIPGMKTAGNIGSVLAGLDMKNKMRLNPLDLQSVGRFVTRMKNAPQGFTREEINLLVKTLYITQAERDFEKAFQIFAPSGSVSREDFEGVLRILAEPEDGDQKGRINDLFDQIDADGSGSIEFEEFVVLLKAVNPKDEVLINVASAVGGLKSMFQIEDKGPGIRMTTKEARLLPQLREQVDGLGDQVSQGNGAGEETALVDEYEELLDDDMLIRYLRACKHKVPDATKRLLKTIKWRKEYDVENILLEDHGEWEDVMEVYWGGKDNMGRPTLIFRFAKHDKRMTAEDYNRKLVYLLEKGQRKFSYDTINIIFDVSNATRAQFDMKLVKMLVQTLQSHYPERMNHTFIYPVGVLERTVWNVVKLAMDPNSAKKMHVLSASSYKDTIAQFYEPNQVEKCDGGVVKRFEKLDLPLDVLRVPCHKDLPLELIKTQGRDVDVMSSVRTLRSERRSSRGGKERASLKRSGGGGRERRSSAVKNEQRALKKEEREIRKRVKGFFSSFEERHARKPNRDEIKEALAEDFRRSKVIRKKLESVSE